jgi:hypothetical protein
MGRGGSERMREGGEGREEWEGDGDGGGQEERSDVALHLFSKALLDINSHA